MAAAAPFPSLLTLDNPAPLLRWLGENPPSFSFEQIKVAEVWSLVALGALARAERVGPLRIEESGDRASGRFAHALGLADVVAGRPPIVPGHEGRTVKLARVSSHDEIEPDARKIAGLLFPASSQRETSETVRYVLVELLRNVIQHSQDPLGGVVAAQYNDRGRHEGSPTVQVAVADAGIGIQASLLPRHPTLTDPQAALDRALWPHISGTFDEGETGTATNAGMGLFFIAEMAKLLAGTLVVASRGATLVLRGDPAFGEANEIRLLESGVGFAGTLVAFEIRDGAVEDTDGLLDVIRKRAQERTPRRTVNKWLRFEEPSPSAGAQKFVVNFAVEDTQAAADFAAMHLIPRLVGKKPVVLDFSGLRVLTQSFLHALLFEPLRLAWALKTEIYVVNAAPAVRSNLELLQNYALGG